MKDIAGSTLETAFDLEFLSNVSKILTNEIGDRDFTDYYRFELAENSLVSLLVSDLSQDTTLFLRNSDGSREIARSANTSTVDEKIELNLKPDVYFLHVSRTANGEATPYKLTAQATSLGPTPVDNAGEILDKAKDLGVLSSQPSSASDFIGNFNGLVNDTVDYYRFELVENSQIDIKLHGLSENASLFLYNSDLTRELRRSTNSSNIEEVITGNFKAGMYYLRVNSSDGTTYNLEASAISLGAIPVDKAGEDRDAARDDGSGIATYDIYVSVNDGDYELWLDNTADTTVTYTGEAGRTYQFYSVAKDNVGYTEDAPRTADATTTPVEAIATVVATTFDVTNDHVITGQANVTFTLANQGTTDATDISAAIVYSNDDIIGNEDDLIVETISIGDLVSGGEINQSISVQLSRELLNSRALADDVTGLGSGYVSESYDYLGIVIDPDSEANSPLNAASQKGMSTDDITYFPWDIDGNGLVTPTDAIFVINRLGQSTPKADIRADFDGNELITPTDAISAINRLGYGINSIVFESFNS
ncbi:pre-peptidase C-terminal domain-containing protein [cf. Phormidesmis sp. LEGE 11477]|uniref:pre-peptidase C-terminal domain-containing protein n=1 Tax=cf. Phormidesmis sp. LEGE 11477 TaxID=1828680 RepID=UPI00187F218D|nr:pre-peptidase C-terminal domain-containing protein [cf. Phormidesmis sp. LEGE 11477]MBE9061111.1 pre-peptidase C-terminal domain-containing protein [cf. Phormidesmis sp. LEGE 11477]